MGWKKKGILGSHGQSQDKDNNSGSLLRAHGLFTYSSAYYVLSNLWGDGGTNSTSIIFKHMAVGRETGSKVMI